MENGRAGAVRFEAQPLTGGMAIRRNPEHGDHRPTFYRKVPNPFQPQNARLEPLLKRHCFQFVAHSVAVPRRRFDRTVSVSGGIANEEYVFREPFFGRGPDTFSIPDPRVGTFRGRGPSTSTPGLEPIPGTPPATKWARSAEGRGEKNRRNQ